MNDTTSLRITKKTNTDIMIVAKLEGKNKEQLAEELLAEALKPHLTKLKRQMFK